MGLAMINFISSVRVHTLNLRQTAEGWPFTSIGYTEGSNNFAACVPDHITKDEFLAELRIVRELEKKNRRKRKDD